MHNKLLDHLIKLGGFKNDVALAKRLGISAPLISRVRHGKMKVSACLMLKIHEEFGVQFGEIRRLVEIAPTAKLPKVATSRVYRSGVAA